MREYLIGAATTFAALIVNKAILEPVATKVGRKMLDRYVGPACQRVDLALELFGVQCDPEEVVRSYLDLEPELDQKQVDQIVAAVFEVWDLRVISRNPPIDTRTP